MRNLRAYLRLVRSCAEAGMTVRETGQTLLSVRRGEWEMRTNRDMLAWAIYARHLIESREENR